MGALRTLRLFAAASLQCVGQLVFSGVAVLVVWPLLLGWAGTRFAAPHLYTPPKCASYGWQKSVTASPLWEAELVLVETAMWFGLGLLSTIGWGTGLRTAGCFLWPFVARVVVQADTCLSTAFEARYFHPCALQCQSVNRRMTYEAMGDKTFDYPRLLLLLAPAVVPFALGAFVGELPPYLLARDERRAAEAAAKRTARSASVGSSRAALRTAVVATLLSPLSALLGMLGALARLLACAVPSPFGDVLSLWCGKRGVPHVATLLVGSLLKAALLLVACCTIFSSEHLRLGTEAVYVNPIEQTSVHNQLVASGRKVRQMLEMRRMHMQPSERLDTAELSAKLAAGRGSGLSDARQLAEMVCEMGSPIAYCGARIGGLSPSEVAAGRTTTQDGRRADFADEEAKEGAMVIAERIVKAWDVNGDDRLEAHELASAASYNIGGLGVPPLDGKTSLFALGGGDTGPVFALAAAQHALSLVLVYHALKMGRAFVGRVARGHQARLDATAAAKRGKKD